MKYLGKEEVRITILYIVFGLLWINLSDKVLLWISNDNAGVLNKLQTFKGSFYILITASFLYILIRSSIRKLQALKTQADVSRERAEQLNKEKTVFLAQMSHEIRTPLNGLSGFVSLLSSPSLSDKQKEKYLQIIQNRSKHLLQVVNDLIDLSKIETQSLTITPESVNLEELFKELTDYYLPKLKLEDKQGVELGYKITGNSTIIIDPTRLRQILINLLDNSIKYTLAGTITITADIKTQKSIFHVTDTGIGIPRNKQHLLFSEHTDIQKHLSQEQKGAGLGLLITRHLIQKMGGTLSFTSSEHEGSTFSFSLPTTTTIISNQAEASPHFYWKNGLIVIIEDDFSSHLYYKELLRPVQAQIKIFDQGIPALDFLLGITEPAIVLLDLLLPDISGFAILEKLRHKRPDIPVIIETANILQNESEKCAQLGYHTLLAKPIPPQKLLSTLNKIVEDREQRKIRQLQ